MLLAEKTDRKFRFVEDFYEEDDERKYSSEEDEEDDEPKLTKTKFFGEVELHQIARIDWREVKVVQEVEKTLPNGNVVVEEKEEIFYEEIMGELGGWLENESNLSQEGECWVEQDGFVMGGAQVSGNAKVSGGAEVGDFAKVRDDVELKGPFGIGGGAVLRDKVKISGEKRMAVFGRAEISGECEVRERAKVYGNAKVSPAYRTVYIPLKETYLTGEPSIKAVIYGNARVYGNAEVHGYVYDDAEVYGNAVVYGRVEGKAHVGGNAFLGEYGRVRGGIHLLRGEVLGLLEGEAGDVNYPIFHLAASSYMVVKKDNDAKTTDENIQPEEKDKIEDRDKVRYEGEIKSLRIYADCSVEECEFKGNVTLTGCSLSRCTVADSFLGVNLYREDSTSYLYLSYAYHYAREYERPTLFVNGDGCTFDRCIIPFGDYIKSKMKDCIVAKEAAYEKWVLTYGSTYYGFGMGGHSVMDSTLEKCSIQKYSMMINNSQFDKMTIDSTTANKLEMSGCTLTESDGYTRVGLFYVRYKRDFDNPYKKLILPEDYKDILGRNIWGKYKGVNELKGIAMYVMKFNGVPDCLFWGADESANKMYDEVSDLNSSIRKRETERREWLDGILEELKTMSDKAFSDKKFTEYVVLNRLYENVGMIASSNVFLLSNDSFERVKSGIQKMIDSYNGETYDSYFDYGLLQKDQEITSYESEYGISFGYPKFT